jgi:hypothetical protein
MWCSASVASRFTPDQKLAFRNAALDNQDHASNHSGGLSMPLRIMLTGFFCLTVLAVAAAQPVPVSEAHGKVQKADKESLTFQPRDSTGKFGKSMTLRITGTSRITTLASPGGQDPVVLSAVIHPSDK